MEESNKLTSAILDYLGLDSVETIEDFKQGFSGDFVKRENIFRDEKIKSEVHGRVFGSVTSKIRKLFKDNGVVISKEEIKDMQLEDVVELGFNRSSQVHKDEAESLRKQIIDPSEVSGQYKEEITTLKKRLGEYEVINSSMQDKLETKDKEFEFERKNTKISLLKKDVKNKISWKDDIKPIEELGFNSKYFDVLGYNIDLDTESDVAYVVDKSGSRIENPNKAGSFYLYEEHVKMMADKEGLTKKNPHTGTPKIVTKEIATSKISLGSAFKDTGGDDPMKPFNVR